MGAARIDVRRGKSVHSKLNAGTAATVATDKENLLVLPDGRRPRLLPPLAVEWVNRSVAIDEPQTIDVKRQRVKWRCACVYSRTNGDLDVIQVAENIELQPSLRFSECLAR